MTKEIIIDGCNVAECGYFEDMHECPDNLNGGYYIQHCYCGLQGDNYCICEQNPNCYFKQLQKLKQENEYLKQEVETWKYQTIKSDELADADFIKAKKYKQALENIKQFLIYADHSNTGNKYFENVEKALNIANEVLDEQK